MIALLFIISFLFHIVFMIIIYQLYQQLQMMKQQNEQHLETVLENFLLEIKEENRRLQMELDESSQETFQEQKTPSTSGKDPILSYVNLNSDEDENTYKQEKQEDKVETSLEGQVLQLYKKGLSAEEIAKKINRGKTEVSLILKLVKPKV